MEDSLFTVAIIREKKEKKINERKEGMKKKGGNNRV
jgi:hypothetical protein